MKNMNAAAFYFKARLRQNMSITIDMRDICFRISILIQQNCSILAGKNVGLSI